MKTKLFLILLLTIHFLGCTTQKEPNDFDYGKIEGNKYINSYFDFEITIPTKWIVQSSEQYDKLAEIGKDLMAGDDTKMKTIIEASQVNTANLLAVYQYEQSATVEYNPMYCNCSREY